MAKLDSEMQAWVVREERHGEPLKAMQPEVVETPSPGVGQVVVRVHAAGINYNQIWACRGKPLTVSRLHPEEPRHIGGSDVAGTVAAVGPGVERWQIGDEVIAHPLQSCGQCVACRGFEPMACQQQKAWGFETSWGSFAAYALLQAQQLLPKPSKLSWAEASCYGLKLFTAYRMLFVQAQIRPRDRVLIWGASGGLGSYAIQLCRAVHATPICVVSSDEKADYCRALGAELIVDRREHPYLEQESNTPSPDSAMREFRRHIRALTGGFDPDIVFEHLGAHTLPTSVFVARRMGKIVICGATTGFRVSFDARYLWMQQKQILGSHGCNAHDAARANLLVGDGVVQPTLTQTYSFAQAARAHEELIGGALGSRALLVA